MALARQVLCLFTLFMLLLFDPFYAVSAFAFYPTCAPFEGEAISIGNLKSFWTLALPHDSSFDLVALLMLSQACYTCTFGTFKPDGRVPAKLFTSLKIIKAEREWDRTGPLLAWTESRRVVGVL